MPSGVTLGPAGHLRRAAMVSSGLSLPTPPDREPQGDSGCILCVFDLCTPHRPRGDIPGACVRSSPGSSPLRTSVMLFCSPGSAICSELSFLYPRILPFQTQAVFKGPALGPGPPRTRRWPPYVMPSLPPVLHTFHLSYLPIYCEPLKKAVPSVCKYVKKRVQSCRAYSVNQGAVL